MTPESSNNISCTTLIFKEISSLIKECFNYLQSMEGRNKDKNEYMIMMDMVYVFYNHVNTNFASEIISETIDELTDFNYEYNY